MRDPEFRAGYIEAYAEMFELTLSSESVQIYEPAYTEFSVTLCSPGVQVVAQPVVVPQLLFGAAVA